MPIYPYSFQLPPLNVQDIPNDGAPGEFLGINVGGALDWLPAGGGGSGDMLAANNLSELTNFATARTNIGLGTASTPTFANLTLTSPSLASSAPVTISQTWNAGSNVMTALKVVATDTASGGTSSLLDAQTTAGGSQFSVRKGVVVGNNYSSSTTYGVKTAFVSFGNHYGSGALCGSTNGLTLFATPTVNSYIDIANTLATIANTNSALAIGAAADTILLRDGAANTLALRNGANAQTFNVYGTYTSGSVYERMFMRYNGTDLAFQVGAETLGATARPLQLWTGGASRLHVTTAGNVGIGTTAPRYRLSNTAIVLSDYSSIEPSITSGFGWMASEANKYAANISNNTANGYGLSIYAASNGTQKLLTLSNNAADVVNFLANGNVGIGTTSPTSKLDVAGLITATGIAANGTNSPRVYALGDSTSTRGLEFFTGGNALYYREGGGTSLAMYPSGIKLNSVSSLGWCSTTPDGGAETFLLRDEQYHLALRNGTNGGKFSVYGTYPGAAWERFTITAPTSGNVLLGTYIGTGGVARGMEFQTDGVTRMTLATNGVVTFPISIVVNSAVRTGFINNVGDSLSMFSFVNDSTGTSTYAVGGSAPLMRFGGTTTSFPAIKRSSTTLQTRLADDSAFAPIQGKLTTDTAFTSGAITDTGYIVLYDSTGTAYKVACTPV